MKPAIAIGAGLLLASTFGFADPSRAPLPAGKPAGIRQAQGVDNTTLYIIASLAVVGIIIGVAASGGNDNSTPATAPPTVTPH